MRKVKVTALLTSLIMIASLVVPIFVSFATIFGDGTYEFSFDAQPTATDVSVDKITINGNIMTSEEDRFRTNDGAYTIVVEATESDSNREASMSVNGPTPADITLTSIENGKYTFTVEYDMAENNQNHLSVSVRSNPKNNGGQQDPVDPPPVEPGDQDDTPEGEDVTFDIKFTDTSMNAWLNNTVVMSDENGLISEYNGTVNIANASLEPARTNTFKFAASFGENEVKVFTINNVEYKAGMDSVRTEIDEPIPGTKVVEYYITVPGASKYTIRGTGDKKTEKAITVIWANPNYVTNDKAWSDEFQLEHGYAYVREIVRDGKVVDPKTYTAAGATTSDIDRGVRSDGFGWISPKAGDKVHFEFVPEYGYQLTDVKANGVSLGVGETMNEFTFTMPNTNVHFDAEFTKTDDVVKTDSEVVTDGAVDLGENKLSGGTAQIVVSDVKLTEDQIKNFAEAAEGLEITSYVDVDLFQVFYKGKDDDEDVWKNQIDELDSEATITIQLPEGTDVTKVAIVHNIHNGDEYEIIKPISYDVENRTVTFKTKSFSNYAIALTSGEEENKEESITPKTGDVIVYYAITLVLAVFGFVVLFRKRK